MPWFGPRAQAFVRGILPIWLTGVLVEAQRYLPLLGPVHTDDMWKLEVSLFPAPGGIPWAEWLNARPVPVLDFFCGASYALYLYEFLAVAVFFYAVGERQRCTSFVWALFASNALGALIYMLLPVAPPWYIIDHGFGPAVMGTLGSSAGCARFDAMLGIHYFQAFYGRNPNVFGAMPSLHVAFPLIVTLYTWNRGLRWRIPCALFTALVAFSAVYLAHHYILDVLAGVAVAVLCWWGAERLFGERPQAYGVRRMSAMSADGVLSVSSPSVSSPRPTMGGACSAVAPGSPKKRAQSAATSTFSSCQRLAPPGPCPARW